MTKVSVEPEKQLEMDPVDDRRGFSGGCFLASAKTIAAFHKIILAAGVKPIATAETQT